MKEPKKSKTHSPPYIQDEELLEEDCKNAIDHIIGQKFDVLKSEVASMLNNFHIEIIR